MKTRALAFITGAACGAAAMFFASRPVGGTPAGSRDAAQVTSPLTVHRDRDDKRIAELEQKIAELEAHAPEGTAATGAPEVKSGVSVIGGGGGAKFDLSEMQEQMHKAEGERAARRVAARLASLTRALSLSDGQAEQVRALLEKQEAQRKDGIGGMIRLGIQTATAGAAEAVAQDLIAPAAGAEAEVADFDTELLALLDEGQAQAYKSYVEAQNENFIEANANRQLAQLQTSIPDLSAEQKDQAFGEFARIARDEVEANSAPVEGGTFDLGRMMRQREAAKAALQGILSPEQLEVYDSSASRTFMFEPGAGAVISTDIRIEVGDSEE